MRRCPAVLLAFCLALPACEEDPPGATEDLEEEVADLAVLDAAVKRDRAVARDYAEEPADLAEVVEEDATVPDDLETSDASPDAAPADLAVMVDGASDAAPPTDLAKPPADLATPQCKSAYVYLKNKQFYLGNDPFVPVSVNYIIDIRRTPAGQYFIAPHHAFCADNLCCSDATTCKTALAAQLAQIKSLGFNSLRVVGLAVIPEGGSVALDCTQQTSPTQIDYCPQNGHLLMWPTDQRGLTLIAEAMTMVSAAGFKAVFLAGHGAVDATGVRDNYARYLTALATKLAGQPAVFAYDLTNEPVYEFANKNITKVEANAIGRLWYDAVRAGTKKQMVTMGLAEIGTVRHWDPGSIPLDFSSFHLYTSGKWDQGDKSYMLVAYEWLGREPYPVLVGETGISVGDNGISEASQQDFAAYTVDFMWSCGTLGVQWWIYRDLHWGPPGEHFGLVRWDGTVRPAAAPFKAFKPTFPRPACTNPYYRGSASKGIFHVRGRLVRDDGTPVRNGYVAGHKCVTGGWEWTLSDDNGNFDLRAGTTMNEIEMTAPGLSIVTDRSLCGVFSDLGEVTLRSLPLSLATSTPSSCP